MIIAIDGPAAAEPVDGVKEYKAESVGESTSATPRQADQRHPWLL